MFSKKVQKNEFYSYDSKKYEIEPKKKYFVEITVVGKQGKSHSAYLNVILLDSKEREISRYVRWLNDFSGVAKNYKISFSSHSAAKFAIVGYRINFETPVKSDIQMELDNFPSNPLKLTNEEDSFDDINQYEVPFLSSLSNIEEDTLEKNLVWLFGAPRSGTTWLGEQLLNHSSNIVWSEPWIGLHLAVMSDQNQNVELPQFQRVIDVQAKGGRYFFSPHHKNNWLPALRKFILSRTYSQVQSLEKNIIIKEPVGAQGSDIIMESFPNSKLLFLIRDGRDVVDSRMDMHREKFLGRIKTIKNTRK